MYNSIGLLYIHPYLHGIINYVSVLGQFALVFTAVLCADPVHFESVFELTVRYLDYPCNRHNQHAWRLLQQIQAAWPEYTVSKLWTDREGWWNLL